MFEKILNTLLVFLVLTLNIFVLRGLPCGLFNVTVQAFYLMDPFSKLQVRTSNQIPNKNFKVKLEVKTRDNIGIINLKVDLSI